MNSRTRLVVVAALVAALVATAGCGMLGSEPRTDVLLVNNDPEGHDVTIDVLEDGESVYHAEYAIDPEDDARLSEFRGTGEYVVAVEVDTETTRVTHEFTSDEETLTISISESGNVSVV